VSSWPAPSSPWCCTVARRCPRSRRLSPAPARRSSCSRRSRGRAPRDRRTAAGSRCSRWRRAG
jgi:hypothetical protein